MLNLHPGLGSFFPLSLPRFPFPSSLSPIQNVATRMNAIDHLVICSVSCNNLLRLTFAPAPESLS